MQREDEVSWLFEEGETYELQIRFFSLKSEVLAISDICQFTIPTSKRQNKKIVKYLLKKSHPAFITSHNMFPKHIDDATYLLREYPDTELVFWMKLYILDVYV